MGSGLTEDQSCAKTEWLGNRDRDGEMETARLPKVNGNVANVFMDGMKGARSWTRAVATRTWMLFPMGDGVRGS